MPNIVIYGLSGDVTPLFVEEIVRPELKRIVAGIKVLGVTEADVNVYCPAEMASGERPADISVEVKLYKKTCRTEEVLLEMSKTVAEALRAILLPVRNVTVGCDVILLEQRTSYTVSAQD